MISPADDPLFVYPDNIPAPAQVDFLSSRVGKAVVFKFVEAVGGQRIHIPEKARGSVLEAQFGTQVAEILCSWRPRERWSVPICKSWRVQVYHANKFSHNQIAKAVGITFDAVTKILSRPYRGRIATRYDGGIRSDRAYQRRLQNKIKNVMDDF